MGRDKTKEDSVNKQGYNYRHINKALTLIHAAQQVCGRVRQNLVGLNVFAIDAQEIAGPLSHHSARPIFRPHLGISLLQLIFDWPYLSLVTVLPPIGMLNVLW